MRRQIFLGGLAFLFVPLYAADPKPEPAPAPATKPPAVTPGRNAGESYGPPAPPEVQGQRADDPAAREAWFNLKRAVAMIQ